LPLEDSSVDGVTSHTVIEHVPNEAFLSEKRRICRSGGRVSVQNSWVKSQISTFPKDLPQVSEREELLWSKLQGIYDNVNNQYNIGKYWADLVELPKLFEKLNFKNIQVNAISFPHVIDDDRNTLEEKTWMIEVQRIGQKESATRSFYLSNGEMSEYEIEELMVLIDKRFDERLEILNSGRNSGIMILIAFG